MEFKYRPEDMKTIKYRGREIWVVVLGAAGKDRFGNERLRVAIANKGESDHGQELVIYKEEIRMEG